MMKSELMEALSRLAMEPPLRIVARAALKRMAVSAETRALWDLSERPGYMVGLLAAAKQAVEQGEKSFSAVEFGVAGGSGLVALERDALAIERDFDLKVDVYGFDMGAAGLPEFIGDYRDHPDIWRPGDFAMDEAALRARLKPRTQLVLGNCSDTVKTFFADFDVAPIGFMSIDVDTYSSTRSALEILRRPDTKMLRRVPLFFDDVGFVFNHRFAGEPLAIDDFNERTDGVKIDRWSGVRSGRPFPERPYLEKMYVAHDLAAISATVLTREKVSLPLE